MKLIVIGSGSNGNGYVLKSREAEGMSLLIEAGCSRQQVLKTLSYSETYLHSLLVTHEHGDHAEYVKQFIDLGIHLIASKGTKEALGIDKRVYSTTAVPGKLIKVGNEWRINSFNVQHDAAEPLGFLLYNEECGKVLFVTDFSQARIHTNRVKTFIVECNWDADTLKASDDTPQMKSRIMLTHQSVRGVKAFLSMQDLSEAERIVLIHGSSRNLDKDLAVREIEKAFGIPVYFAQKGLEIEL